MFKEQPRWLDSILQREKFIESNSSAIIHFRLAEVFKTQKPPEQLPAGYAIGSQTPRQLEAIHDTLYADERGRFIFPKNKLVLGRTRESVDIPLDEAWYLKILALSPTGKFLPLLTHANAPFLHSGVRGNITFEFYNFHSQDLLVNIRDISAMAFVQKLQHPVASGHNGQFAFQSLETNWFGDLSKFD